jgi:PadR family transcriptional regulator PadR
MDIDRELLKGSISLVLLKLLSERDMYGYEIIQETARRSRAAFAFKEGTLYPALHQLERRGYLRSAWRVADNGRERKYYSLTAKGKTAARESRRRWGLFTSAINAILVSE